MATLLQVPTQNSIQYTLDTQYTPGDTTLTLSATLTGVVQAPSVCVIDRVDTSGTSTPTKHEYFKFTGVSGTQLTGITGAQGGSTNQSHSVGAVVEFVPDVVWAQSVYDTFTAEHSTAGVHNTTYVVTPSATQSLTNKTITDLTNNVMAKSLKSATTTVDVSAATAPTSGQVLTATGGTAATWQTPATAPVGADGWTSDSNTWTYSSVDGSTGVITVNADVTGLIQKGDWIKFTQTTVKYFKVMIAPTYSAPNTTITVNGGTDYTLANAAISSPSYSHMKNPYGVNTDPTKWYVRVTDTTDRSQASAVASTWYNLGTTASQITLPIGTWNVTYNVNLQQSVAAVVGVFVTLSTANNTESDSEMTSGINSAAAFAGGNVTKTKTITVAAKTTYYLNTMTTSGSTPTIYNRNSSSGSAMIIEARNAFL